MQTRCTRCGRALTSPASVRRGYGKGCAARIRHAAADLTGYQPHQLDSAQEAIEDQAALHLRGPVHLVVSADGSRTHRTTAHHCTCAAGVRGTRCWHTAAVRILTAPTLVAARPVRVFALAA